MNSFQTLNIYISFLSSLINSLTGLLTASLTPWYTLQCYHLDVRLHQTWSTCVNKNAFVPFQVGWYETIPVDTFYVLRRFCQPVWFHIHLPAFSLGSNGHGYDPDLYIDATNSYTSEPAVINIDFTCYLICLHHSLIRADTHKYSEERWFSQQMV